MRWLRLDAQNRAWRTILQGLAVTVVIAVGDALVQVVRSSLADAAGGVHVEPREVFMHALTAAGFAALMAAVAYAHRVWIDPSRVPSAQPPLPPGVPPSAAPATDVPSIP